MSAVIGHVSLVKIFILIEMIIQESLVLLILQGPIEAVVGVVWGIVWGLLLIILPPTPTPNVLLRVVLLLGRVLASQSSQ